MARSQMAPGLLSSRINIRNICFSSRQDLMVVLWSSMLPFSRAKQPPQHISPGPIAPMSTLHITRKHAVFSRKTCGAANNNEDSDIPPAA